MLLPKGKGLAMKYKGFVKKKNLTMKEKGFAKR
jgi:hypothetical protein